MVWKHDMINFWHIQLHPKDRANFPAEVVLRLLNEQSIIGIGEGWENDGGRPDHFQNWMQLGDIVAVRDGGNPIALVEVTGPCERNGKDNCWFDLIRSVKILSTSPPPYPDKYFKMTSCALQREVNPAFVRFWYNKVKEDKQMETLKNLLEQCHNLILTGAPGTGKTYLAREIAKEITGNERYVAFALFHPSYDYTDFVEGLRPMPAGENGMIGFQRQDGVFKAFCKRVIIHAAFRKAYKAFLRDLKENGVSQENPKELRIGEGNSKIKIFPNSRDSISFLTGNEDRLSGSLTLEMTLKTNDGEKTWDGWESYYNSLINYLKVNYIKDNWNMGDYDQKYVFIIDEINRGDIAKIFGELFFAIDPDYRGEKGKVPTQYANLIEDDDLFKDGFYVPENVYIIGTMNDIDRNVECMDFAIRRRFTWVEIKPDDTITMWDDPEKGIPEYKDKAKTCMEAINKAIKDTPGLGSAYQLGAAYFLKLKNYGGDFEKLWKNHIEPLLKEYLRGIPDAVVTVNGMKQKWDSALQSNPTESTAISIGPQNETEQQTESAESQPATEQQ